MVFFPSHISMSYEGAFGMLVVTGRCGCLLFVQRRVALFVNVLIVFMCFLSLELRDSNGVIN
jgi:hypothetical protein